MNFLISFVLFVFIPFSQNVSVHPVYVSVTNMDYNEGDGKWESSSRIFTHDFEITLRKRFEGKVDLLNPEYKKNMDSLVESYMKLHFSLKVNGADIPMRYVGFEQDEEAVLVFMEGNSTEFPARVEVQNSLLYDFRDSQSAILHVTKGSVRKSSRNVNPVDYSVFEF